MCKGTKRGYMYVLNFAYREQQSKTKKKRDKLVRHNGAEIAVPEGEKRRTLTAELWAVPLGTRPLWKEAVGSRLSDPSDDTTQICESRNATASVRKWKCGPEMGKISGAPSY